MALLSSHPALSPLVVVVTAMLLLPSASSKIQVESSPSSTSTSSVTPPPQLQQYHRAGHPESADIPDDYIISPWRTSPFQPLQTKKWSGLTPHTNRNYTAYSGILQDSNLFSFELPPQGCQTRNNVTTSALMFGCELATNGGFFSFSGACEGDTIINGTNVTWAVENRAVFGLLSNHSTLVGYLNEFNDLGEGVSVVSALSGLGWLVREGKSYVKQCREFAPYANSSFVTEKAPRTSVGLMPDGSIILVVVDGIEVLGVGPDLFEFADILIDVVGVEFAINLDGGGSSDAVLNGQVWSQPTCADQPTPICERPVTSITCMHYA